MTDVFEFVLAAEPLKVMEVQEKTKSGDKIISILVAMAVQTSECAYFIRTYAEKKSFCTSFIFNAGFFDLTCTYCRDQVCETYPV